MRAILAALVADLALPAAPAGAAEPFAVLGLRSGASRAEVQAVFPQMLFEEVPYLDPPGRRSLPHPRRRPGDPADRGADGRAARPARGLAAGHAHGRPRAVPRRGDRGRAGRRLRAGAGPPARALRPSGARRRHRLHALARGADPLYARQLEFRCLEPGRGLYVLTRQDPFRRRLFMKRLARRLRPPAEETLMILR